MKKTILLLPLLLLLVRGAVAQAALAPADSVPQYRPQALAVIGRSYGDSVVLRWAPREAVFWQAANRAGYVVRRYTVEGNKPSPSRTGTTLTAQPVKPWPLETWKSRVRRDDTLAAMAAEVLHRKAATTLKNPRKGASMGEIMDTKVEQDNRHGLALLLADQSALVATGLGLRWVDRTVEKGKTYVYTVHALVDPKRYRSDTAAVLVNTDEVLPLPALPPVTVEQLDRTVKFSWDRESAGMFFSGYFLERSDDKGQTFRRLNRQPYVQPVPEDLPDPNPPITLVDSLPRNYQPYLYRIYGLTPFGELGQPTENLPVMGRDLDPPAPPHSVSAENTTGSTVRLRWQKEVQELDFAGFLVGRSENVNGPFVPLTLTPLPKTATEYVDAKAVPHGTNYYVVAAIDTAGNAGLSVPAYVIMIDTIAPKKPTGLAGQIDTTGIVRLWWKPGPELDLYGYLVYYANARDHDFTPLTRDFIADTTFTDSISLHTLTKTIYYRIVAFDRNRNPSPYSDILELKKPDKVPPVPGVFTEFVVSDSSVVLTWVPSSSNDLASQVLYRREGEGEWQELAKLPKTQSSYTDRQVQKQTWYEYGVVAVDDGGLRSERSFPLRVRVYDSGVRQRVEGLTARLDPDGKGVQVSWKYPPGTSHRFLLYRSHNGGGLQVYRSLSASDLSFLDQRVGEAEYLYAVKAVYEDGGESPLTPPVKIRFARR